MKKATSIFFTCLIVAGCESTPFQKSSPPPVELLSDGKAVTGTSGAGLTGSTQRRFKDIPLPAGVREDTERTFVYDSKAVRIGKMVYTSKDSANALAQFFIANTPADGWELISTTQADDSINLFFEKPGRRMNINIRRGGVGRSNELIINYLPAEEL